MLKKILFSSIFFFSIENQPFFTEFFALIGFAACARSKPVKIAACLAWNKFKGTPKASIPDFKEAYRLTKFEQGSKIALVSYAWRAKEFMSQGRSKFGTYLEAFKNRMRNPVVFTTGSSQATTYGYSAASYGPSRSANSAINDACSTGNAGAYAGSSQKWSFGNLSVFTQQTNQQQNNYGLFHWYGSEKSKEWTNQFGQKRFWQGAFGGSLLTAWLLKPSETKKDRKN